jgi:hypothetical protein
MLARAWLWRQGVVRVQRIRVPDTGDVSWIVIDGEHVPVEMVNEYLVYLHRLGRSPNTVRAYAHHLQARFNLYSTPADICGIDSFCACCTRAGCASGRLRAFFMPTSGRMTVRSISCRGRIVTALLQNPARRMWCTSRNRRWHCTRLPGS